MRSKLARILTGAVVLASVAGGPAVALASTPHNTPKHHAARTTEPAASESAGEASGEQAKSSEPDNDSARQAAACQTAGVDPNGSNVQYDEQTGTCTATGSAGGGDQTQQ